MELRVLRTQCLANNLALWLLSNSKGQGLLLNVCLGLVHPTDTIMVNKYTLHIYVCSLNDNSNTFIIFVGWLFLILKSFVHLYFSRSPAIVVVVWAYLRMRRILEISRENLTRIDSPHWVSFMLTEWIRNEASLCVENGYLTSSDRRKWIIFCARI